MGHLSSTNDAPISSTALSPAVLSATVVPPVVPPLYPKYGVIHRNSFTPLGRSCIPFHSCPGNAAFIVRHKCAHVYAAIFPSLSHPFTAVPYLTIFFPPSASLDSMWRIDHGSKPDRL
ncbi:hypothetical protein XELAEV_18029386mg [Xenopus laevis]|uniref:Uncharacterized protein n=1 Tax=Xenopus laevis TaxID=8355 RepID=A0A974CRW0_XENLA|nr:hypothetical protein XELAEV_18029386mg [Xenopus laevis]